jgi:VIT1/CCC1 family predicted Fe2+/Mn2+ transporter
VNVVLWVIQVLLALAFLGAGFDQAGNYDSAAHRMAWVARLPRRFALTLGALEIVGAIALIVPAAFGVLQWTAVAAAAALAVVMALAVGFHATRREVPQLAFSAFLGIVAAVVVIGRVFVAPF